MTFRKATYDDIPGIMRVIDYARNRMLAEGKKQWDASYPLQSHITADIEAGYAYVLCNDHTLEITAYGAVIFDGEQAYNNLIEGKWLSDMPYVVLHRIAVAKEARNHGTATRFMCEIEQLMREKGIHSFRIDTNYDNTAMLHLLDKQGFSYCGEVVYNGTKTRMAFEKIIT